MTLIKEMEYKPQPTEPEILARDFYEGYEYVVISRGTFPCAYIVLQEGQPYFDVASYEDVSVKCHGGCTFAEKGHSFDSLKLNDCTVIGWDYRHFSDFSGIYLQEKFPVPWQDMKWWTTEEIIEECKQVIDQLYILERPELYFK